MDKLIFIGDLEGDYLALQEFDQELKNNDVNALLFQVGDTAIFNNSKKVQRVHAYRNLAKSKNSENAYRAAATAIDFKNGDLKKLNNPMHFIKGDIEDFQGLEVEVEFTRKLRQLNIFYVPNARVLQLGGYTIAALGGIFSPTKYYKHTRYLSEDDWNINRFFFEREVATIKEVVNTHLLDVDILVTHQAPANTLPFTHEEGTKKINWLLDEIKPEYLIHGHHHKNYQTTLERADGGITKVVGLGNFSKNQNSKIILETK